MIVKAKQLPKVNILLEKNNVYRVYVSSAIFVVYFSKLLLAIFVLVDDVQRGIKWLFKKLSPSKTSASQNNKGITRSDFLAKAGVITAAAPLVLLTKGIVKGGYDYRIHRVPLYLKNLPQAFHGLKVVQLSDIHTGSLLDTDAVKRGVDMVKAEKADLIFFTGDLVNNQTNEAYNLANVFSEIKAPMGVFSIFGNHDYGDYSKWPSPEAKAANFNQLVKLHGDMGWHLLRNEHVTLDKEGQRIALLGVENWGNKGRFQKFGDIAKAKQHLPDVSVKLLLSHDPSHFDDIVSKHHQDIDVTFSGHTHGMQFGIEWGNIKWSPSQYLYPHWAGLYEVNGTRLYVNRGFGFLGYPGRIGILPEITVFELLPIKI